MCACELTYTGALHGIQRTSAEGGMTKESVEMFGASASWVDGVFAVRRALVVVDKLNMVSIAGMAGVTLICFNS